LIPLRKEEKVLKEEHRSLAWSRIPVPATMPAFREGCQTKEPYRMKEKVTRRLPFCLIIVRITIYHLIFFEKIYYYE
jgi:hypothetical protein